MHALFSRVPAVLWTGILAFVLTVSAGAVWTVLLVSNVATSPAIPWAVAVMALLLWLMWQYLERIDVRSKHTALLVSLRR